MNPLYTIFPPTPSSGTSTTQKDDRRSYSTCYRVCCGTLHTEEGRRNICSCIICNALYKDLLSMKWQKQRPHLKVLGPFKISELLAERKLTHLNSRKNGRRLIPVFNISVLKQSHRATRQHHTQAQIPRIGSNDWNSIQIIIDWRIKDDKVEVLVN